MRSPPSLTRSSRTSRSRASGGRTGSPPRTARTDTGARGTGSHPGGGATRGGGATPEGGATRGHTRGKGKLGSSCLLLEYCGGVFLLRFDDFDKVSGMLAGRSGPSV